MESERDWSSNLPKGIANVILDKLDEPKDHANFGAVCKDWHLFRKDYIRKQPLLPMLLVPTLQIGDDDGELMYSRTQRSLYSISTGKIYDVSELSVPDKRRYSGSSHGWLATVEEKSVIVLINPFRNGLKIRVPPLIYPELHEFDNIGEEWHDYNVYNVFKAILSADPLLNPDSYMVVAIYSFWRRIALYKSSQNSWTYLDRSIIDVVDAVIMCKGLVYAVVKSGNDIIFFDANSSNGEPKRFKSRKPRPENINTEQHHLVVSSKGEVLQVHRCFDVGLLRTNATKSFEVFKLQFLVQEKGEIGIVDKAEVKSLGNYALFLGLSSFFVPVDTQFRLCKPNSIYYTADFITADYRYAKHKDVGSFNFEDRTFRPYYKYHPCQEWNEQMPSPLWVTPLLL